MTPAEIQRVLEAKFADDHSRAVRMRHFMGLLRTAVDGLATMGIVLRVDAEGLEGAEVPPPPPDPLNSLAEAIAHIHKEWEK